MSAPDWAACVDEATGETVIRLRIETPDQWTCWIEDGVAWNTYAWDDGRAYSLVYRVADRAAHEQLALPGVAG
jgi:hypothetical protein